VEKVNANEITLTPAFFQSALVLWKKFELVKGEANDADN
jgi:hypothetical protein